LGSAEKVLRVPEQELTRRLIAATPRMGAVDNLPRVV
jgi:hypothetical protein